MVPASKPWRERSHGGSVREALFILTIAHSGRNRSRNKGLPLVGMAQAVMCPANGFLSDRRPSSYMESR